MKIKKDLIVKILVILGAFLVVYMLIDLRTRVNTMHFLENQKQTLEADVIHLQSTAEAVEERITYAESDTAVDEWARQQGLMRKEGDHVIIPLQGEYSTPTPTPEPEIIVTEAPNWKIWESLIF